jgi:hypothetical protein
MLAQRAHGVWRKIMQLPVHAFQAPFLRAFGVALLVSGCGQVETTGDAFTLPNVDAAADLHGEDAETDAAAAGTDATLAEIASDVQAVDVAVDSEPLDAPPVLQALLPLTLAQGASTTLDLNPLISDAEDPDAQLQVLWSAHHVALQDPGSHVLYVVAPTTWTGTEAIVMTVRDAAGLTATATLQVTVTEVTIAPPPTTDACGKVTFTVAAGKGQHTVLLSGSFNAWGSDEKTADVMTDPGSTGAWTVVKTLAPGVYQYKFIVDGKWQADPNDPNQVPDGYGGQNSVVEVPQCKP